MNLTMTDGYKTHLDTKESKNLLSRLVSFERACELSLQYGNQQKKVVFTSGSWDIVHSAHLHYLQYLRSCGDILIVGVDNNNSVRRLKGEEHPFFDEHDRAMIIANFRSVDHVFIYEGVWQVEHLLKLKPAFVGVPPFDPNMKNKCDKIKLAGTEVVVTPPFLKSDLSSRKARILKNDYLVTNVVLE